MKIQTFAERLQIERVSDLPSSIWSTNLFTHMIWSKEEVKTLLLPMIPDVSCEPNEAVDVFLKRVGFEIDKQSVAKRTSYQSILCAAFDNPHIKLLQCLPGELLLWNQRLDRLEILGNEHITDFENIWFNSMILRVWSRHLPAWDTARKLLCDKIAGSFVNWVYPADPNFNVNLGQIVDPMFEVRAAYVVVLQGLDDDLRPVTQINRAKPLIFPASIFAQCKPITGKRIQYRENYGVEIASTDPTAEDVIRGGLKFICEKPQTAEALINNTIVELRVYGYTGVNGAPWTPDQHVLFLLESDVNMDLIRHLGIPLESNPA